MNVYHYKNCCSIVVNNICFVETEDVQYSDLMKYNILIYFCTGINKKLNFPSKEERDIQFDFINRLLREN